ncbi:unnamed protein product [Spirodela intermedia]|uniref:Uncharacterized protein n=1 Tax=Spirodela intermedia TaxID=51605 RepID=A0A7I8ISK1_SPIIN|nr:unnamed protein product [Spirodela intermedia]CAA6660982.1 unnamed protein product [Spirodela intermedia]
MEASTATAGAKKPHPLPWLDLLVREPFYLLHFLAFFSYFVARSSATEIFSSRENYVRLLRREIQAILAFLVLAVVKAVNQESQEAYIADVVFYAKMSPSLNFSFVRSILNALSVFLFELAYSGFPFALALLIDYHLAICYLIGFLVIFVLAQQPSCDNLGDSCKLTPLQLETLLTEGGTSRYWLVEFRNQFSSRCIRTSRLLPELSVIYSNKNISFGIIDLGHFPNCADKYGISVEGALGQLPTYVLFDHSTEVARFPRLADDSNSPAITRRILCRHFDLDRRLIEYIAGR